MFKPLTKTHNSQGTIMQSISSISELEALYGQPSDAAIRKVSSRLTPLYRRWIMASRFCVLTSVGPDGTDGSPRGEDGPVVHELDSQTLEENRSSG